MKISEIENTINEIELATDLGKRSLGRAEDLDSAYTEAVDHELIIDQQPLRSQSQFTVVLAQDRHQSGRKLAMLVDTAKNHRVAVLTQLMQHRRHGLEVDETKVRPAYQGQGLGLKLYQSLVRDFGIILISGGVQSVGGARLWASLYRTPGISVYGYNPKSSENRFFDVDFDAAGNLDSLSGRDLYEPDTGTVRRSADAMNLRLIAAAA